MEIKRLQNQEIVDALHLIWEVFVSESAPKRTPREVEQFRQYIRLDHLRPLLESGQLVMFGAYERGQLGGASAVQSDGQIRLLFVRRECRKKGMGYLLTEAMYKYCARERWLSRMTLNAYPEAEGALKELGFMTVGPIQEQEGVRLLPMECPIQLPDTGPQKPPKSHKGLIAGIIAAALLFLILMGLLLGRITQEIMKMADAPGSHSDGQEEPFFEGPQDPEEGEEPEDPYGDETDPDPYGAETGTGIGSIPCYTAENLPYTIREETYSESPQSQSGQVFVSFEVKYPQIEGLENGKQDEINQILKECAMSTVNALYLEPSDETKAYMLKQKEAVLASFVTYRVTYAGEDFISVVFNDEYYAGNASRGYVHLRTRNIRLSDAKEYKVEDIVDLSSAFMTDWMERMRGEAPGEDVLYGVHLDEFRRVLGGEILNNRYYEGFFVDADGLEIGLTYHYFPSEEENEEQNGWITAPFTMEEIAPYRTDSEFWGLIEGIH